MNQFSRLFGMTLLAAFSVTAAFAADTGMIASNYAMQASVNTPSGGRYGFIKGVPFVQTFRATEGGFPAQLIVNMGVDCGRIVNLDVQGTMINNYTASARLVVTSPSGKMADETITGLKQDGTDRYCTMTFPISNAYGPIQRGENASVSLTITTVTRFNAAMGTMVDDGNLQYVAVVSAADGWPLTPYNNFNTALHMQLKTTPITMTANPPSGGAIVWEDGTSCGTQCSQSQNRGATHTFIARPAAGYTFGSWNPPCIGQQATCSVAPSAGMPLYVTFKTAP